MKVEALSRRITEVPIFEREEVSLYYEEYGSGFPVLLFAPGGMRSDITYWQGGPFNPIEVLSKDFRVIAMDQRNAGQSVAPITADDGWHSYTSDHAELIESWKEPKVVEDVTARIVSFLKANSQ